jgi:hypothetical protein
MAAAPGWGSLTVTFRAGVDLASALATWSGMRGEARQRKFPAGVAAPTETNTQTPAQLFVETLERFKTENIPVQVRITPTAYVIEGDSEEPVINVPRVDDSIEEVERTALQTLAILAREYSLEDTLEALHPIVTAYVAELAKDLNAVASQLNVAILTAGLAIMEEAQRFRAPAQVSIGRGNITDLNSLAVELRLPVELALVAIFEQSDIRWVHDDDDKWVKANAEWEIVESNSDVDAGIHPRNDLSIVDTAEAIEAARAMLSRVFPAERVGKALEDLATGGESAGTDVPATVEPRPDGVTLSPHAAPRRVTAEELVGNVPSALRVKPHKKYDFPAELLDKEEAIKAEQSIANARKRKMRAGEPLSEDEDERGKMAESFVKQAGRRRAHTALKVG